MHGDTPETLLYRICLDPWDDAARLDYAAFLDLVTDPHGEFIRTQIELAKTPALLYGHEHCDPDDCRVCKLLNRSRDLLPMHGFSPIVSWTLRNASHHVRPPWLGFTAIGGARVYWQRGFADMIYCDIEQWVKDGPLIVGKSPITCLRFQNKSPRAVYAEDNAKTIRRMVSPVDYHWSIDIFGPPQPYNFKADQIPKVIFEYMAGHPGQWPIKGPGTVAKAYTMLSIAAINWAREQALMKPLPRRPACLPIPVQPTEVPPECSSQPTSVV